MNYIDYNTFASRARKNDLHVTKLDISYPIADTRCWTAIINQGTDNVLVTLNVNRYQFGNQYFDILSSSKTITDVYVEDVYETLELLLNVKPETIYFNNQDV